MACEIMAILIFSAICHFVENNGFKIKLSKEQNFYSDIIFIDRNVNKYVIDIESTYRDEHKIYNISDYWEYYFTRDMAKATELNGHPYFNLMTV